MYRMTVLSLIIVFFCQSCAGQQAQPASTPNPESNLIQETPDMSTMPSPSVTIDPRRQRGEVVSVSVGDVFAVNLPQGSSKWAVDYANSVVEPLTPAGKMNEPGPDGWLFRAVAAGQTDIRLTAPAAKCTEPPPCPPPSPWR